MSRNILFSLPKIKVKNKITDQEKYDYLFSVDTLNNDVISGKPFRMAYQDLGKSIEEGQYVPNRKIKHTHIGSIE